MKTPRMTIAGRAIGTDTAPFVIAEMSGNHNQSLANALEIVDAAARTGAHALKLQTYTADTMTLDCDKPDFQINDPKSLWNGYSLYSLYEKAHTPWEWHRPIFERARQHGMIAFSTPFDASAVDFLESLDVPAYKIASFENTDIPLIRKVARTGKPVIVSTGMASVLQITEAVETLRQEGCEEFALLKCTSSYPASPADSHLRALTKLSELFNCVVGLSDHTLGIGAAVASVAFGASIIEKHFIIDRKAGGVDSEFSLEPDEMRALVEESERARLALGSSELALIDNEKPNLRFRRSLYVSSDIREGELLTEKNIRCIRPGFGLPPKEIDRVLGKKAARNLERGTPLSWDLVR